MKVSGNGLIDFFKDAAVYADITAISFPLIVVDLVIKRMAAYQRDYISP